MATKLPDDQVVEYVMERLEVDALWVFSKAFQWHEIREEKWWISWKIKEFREFGVVHPAVLDFCNLLIDCNQALFFKGRE